MEHRWAWCRHCAKAMVECGTCGNNTCSAGVGTRPDGTKCGDCADAYAKACADPRPRHPNEAELAPKDLQRLVEAAGDLDPLDYFMEIRDRCIDPTEAAMMVSDLCGDPDCKACVELGRVMYPESLAALTMKGLDENFEIPYPPPAEPSGAVSLDDLLDD